MCASTFSIFTSRSAQPCTTCTHTLDGQVSAPAATSEGTSAYPEGLHGANQHASATGNGAPPVADLYKRRTFVSPTLRDTQSQSSAEELEAQYRMYAASAAAGAARARF